MRREKRGGVVVSFLWLPNYKKDNNRNDNRNGNGTIMAILVVL